ncbi:MAG: tetratricopeptide repeat protein [Rhodospirillaceae bacterium]|nr:tetratricopeptide repeat protein [Rhodospirillaceae bacterium]
MMEQIEIQEITDSVQALLQQKKLDAAMAVLKRTYEEMPNHPLITLQLGYVLFLKNNLEEAEYYLEITLQKSPLLPGLIETLIPVYQNLGQSQKAKQLLKKALIREPEKINLLLEYADLLYSKQSFELALICYKQALTINPTETRAQANIAESLAELQRPHEALSFIEMALSRNPNSKQLALNRALTLLSLKKYKEGWHAYEARLSDEIDEAPKRLINIPRWTSQSLTNKTILVCSEQGVGDELLFSAYLRKLAPLAKRIIVETDPRLVPLFSRSFENLEIYPYSRRVSGTRVIYDYHWLKQCRVYPDLFVEAASLPYFLKETHKESVAITPHLKDDINATKVWKNRLKKISNGKPLIGLFWRSSLYTNDRKHFYPTIDLWQPILSLKNVKFLSLQFDDDSHDISLAKQLFGVNILKVDGINLRNDFDEIASLCKGLTGVIAPSTTTAHLSGSVGTKTIVIDRTTNWSPKINNFDAVLPSIQHIWPPQVDDWNWVFTKARSVAQRWIQDENHNQIIP